MNCSEEPVKIHIQGGWLMGVYHAPEGAGEGKKFPIVVMLHGYTGSHMEDRRMYVDLARELCENGIAAFRFDYRGHGDSSGKFEDFDLDEAVQDAMTGFDFAAKLSFADDERMGLLGLSMGGYIATRIAPKLDVKALALLSPALKIPKRALIPEVRDGYVYMNGLRLRLDKAEKVDSMDSFPFAKSITVPLLIIHAKDDEWLYPSSVEFVKQVASEDKRLLTLEKGGHVFSDFDIRKRVFGELTSWFADRLRTRREPQLTPSSVRDHGYALPPNRPGKAEIIGRQHPVLSKSQLQYAGVRVPPATRTRQYRKSGGKRQGWPSAGLRQSLQLLDHR